MPLMRLQKYLSKAGFCSRRKGEEYIVKGLVRVNDQVVTELGTKIEPGKDQVEIEGKIIEVGDEILYIALNKPLGFVSSCSQPGDRTVLELVDIQERVYPVGRLDKDSTGLILLTNDGALHHKLSHPSFDHEKEYDVQASKPILDGALKAMAKGLPMMGTKTRPAKIKRLSSRRFRITLKEGRNRQIRRMLRKVGNEVARLKRIRVSNIRLGKLAEGEWRFLTDKEKKRLLT